MTAFCNDKIDKTLYMKQPEEFNIVNHGNPVYKRRKAIYSLKQSIEFDIKM